MMALSSSSKSASSIARLHRQVHSSVYRPVRPSRQPRSAPIVAFQVDESATQPSSFIPSRKAILQEVESTVASGGIYGKPLKQSELAGLAAAVEHFGGNSGAAAAGGREALQKELMAFLKDAALKKTAPLQLVEGAMVMLEQLYLQDARKTGGELKCNMTREEMLSRWQLIAGTDVGSIQYIPVVEELEVQPDGGHFALDTDLNLLFTGFSGESAWLSPGHLQYHVQNVRIEFRAPKGWVRGAKWLAWRARQGASGAKHYNEQEAEPDYGNAEPDARTCRPDPARPALNLPFPFPVNELFIFHSDGEVGVVRNKLAGLMLLLNIAVRDKQA